jgi:hypothetical protein
MQHIRIYALFFVDTVHGGVKLRMTSDDSTHHSPSMLVKTIVFTYGDSTYIYIRVCFQFQAFQVSILQIHAYTIHVYMCVYSSNL